MEERTTQITARLVVSLGDVLIQVVPVEKASTTIGRRPYNDVVLDDLTVSGEHAVIKLVGTECTLLDLNSRNGLLINSMPIERQLLADGDILDIGAFRLKFVVENASPLLEPYVDRLAPKALTAQTSTIQAQVLKDLRANHASTKIAKVTQINGRGKGKETLINKPIVSLGKAGSHVATIALRPGGYFLTHIEGLAVPIINGESVGIGSHPLADGDAIELGGTMYKFHLMP